MARIPYHLEIWIGLSYGSTVCSYGFSATPILREIAMSQNIGPTVYEDRAIFQLPLSVLCADTSQTSFIKPSRGDLCDKLL